MADFKVCLDPGHAGGRFDPGACNAKTGLQEADVALLVCRKIEYWLKQQPGVQILLTRRLKEDAASDDLSVRTDMANDWGADIFVSVHCNSFSNPNAKGTEIWTTKGQTQGDILATHIMHEIVETFPELPLRADTTDGDVDKESNFYVLRYTDAPACLVEMAFISNDNEAAGLADDDWCDRMAQAIVRGILAYRQESE